jgi:hypothetical protein
MIIPIVVLSNKINKVNRELSSFSHGDTQGTVGLVGLVSLCLRTAKLLYRRLVPRISLSLMNISCDSEKYCHKQYSTKKACPIVFFNSLCYWACIKEDRWKFSDSSEPEDRKWEASNTEMCFTFIFVLPVFSTVCENIKLSWHKGVQIHTDFIQKEYWRILGLKNWRISPHTIHLLNYLGHL